jgi:hypothetical protein
MVKSVINVGAAANDGTGDTERAAWQKANANFTDLYRYQSRLIVPRFIFAGDSKSVYGGKDDNTSWAKWAWAMSGIEYKYDSSLDSCGVNGATSDNSNTTPATNGSGTATVLGFAHDTNVAVITGRVAARAAAGDSPVVWFQMGTNSTGSETSTLAALQKVINACRTAGAVMFLVNEIPPLGGWSASAAANTAGQNKAMERWCDSQSDVKFIRHGIATVDPTAATSTPLGTTNVSGSNTSDGTHESGLGAYNQGKFMAPQLQALFRPARVRYMGKGDVYQTFFGASAYPTSGLGANLIKNPFATGTTGSDTSTKGGTSSVVGSVPDNFRLSGNLSGDVVATLSQVANSVLNGLTGRSDFTALRLEIAGTPTANDTLTLAYDPTGASPSRHPVFPAAITAIGQVLVKCNALTGLQGLQLRAGYGGGSFLNVANATYLSNDLPPLEGQFFSQGRGESTATPTTASPVNYGSPPDAGFSLVMRSGRLLSGSIDLIFCDSRLVQAVPAPLA